MQEKPIKLAALSGVVICLLAVAIGAFGAHALKDVLVINQREEVFDLANRYQFFHGLALMLVAALFRGTQPINGLNLIARLMVSGTIIFCLSLYLLALLNISWLGAVTPIGGVLLLFAWVLLLMRLLKG